MSSGLKDGKKKKRRKETINGNNREKVCVHASRKPFESRIDSFPYFSEILTTAVKKWDTLKDTSVGAVASQSRRDVLKNQPLLGTVSTAHILRSLNTLESSGN